jgi:hypothetical protein
VYNMVCHFFVAVFYSARQMSCYDTWEVELPFCLRYIFLVFREVSRDKTNFYSSYF